ncbi:MAG: class I SAM-dependent methyltransferase [Bacteroidia bacterium]
MAITIINPLTKKTVSLHSDNWVDEDENTFFLKKGAYRFVNGDNYTTSFGFQWNKFERTQIDRFQQSSQQSRERFFAVTGWDKEDLTNQNILEVGSGAGRFSQIVLQHTHATLYSVDYSDAVEANFRNNGPHDRFNLFQASIYELPFAPAQFDKVFCFGVLQHTPDFKKSVQCIVEMVKPGGELVVDFYPIRGWYTKVHAKYLLRPFFRRMSDEKLLSWIERNADGFISCYNFFDRLGLGRIINRFLPICDIKHTIPRQLDRDSLREWVVLDTFDMFSPTYDNPQRLETVVNWFKEFKMRQVVGSTVRYGLKNKVTYVKGQKP